jgi:AbrB family looped-hinge helix DNA binding protein
MRQAAKVGAKRQVTIPKRIRDQLRLSAGDRLDFELAPDGSVTLRSRRREVQDFGGMLHCPGKWLLTVEEMGAAIACHLQPRK